MPQTSVIKLNSDGPDGSDLQFWGHLGNELASERHEKHN